MLIKAVIATAIIIGVKRAYPLISVDKSEYGILSREQAIMIKLQSVCVEIEGNLYILRDISLDLDQKADRDRWAEWIG